MKYVCYWCHGRGWLYVPNEWEDVKVPCDMCVGRGRPSFVLTPEPQVVIEAEYTVIEVKDVVVETKALAADAGAADAQGGDAQGTRSVPVDGPVAP